MQHAIESELLSFLSTRKKNNKKVSSLQLQQQNTNNNSNNHSSSSCTTNLIITLTETEDWIVLDKIHQLLSAGQTLTQRGFYYSFPQLYKLSGGGFDGGCGCENAYSRCISHLNRIVEKIQSANSKFDLNVTSTGKSLLFGSLLYFVSVDSHNNNNNAGNDKSFKNDDDSFNNNNNSIIMKTKNNGDNDDDDDFRFTTDKAPKVEINLAQKSSTGHILSFIDAQTAHDFNFSTSITRIIFVEKEAVAKQLISSSSTSKSTSSSPSSLLSFAGNNILCTKGYPCHSSTMFLRRLVEEFVKNDDVLQQAKFQNNINNSRKDVVRKSLEICFIGDCDPHGVQIILTICGLNTTSTTSRRKSNHLHRQMPSIFDEIRMNRNQGQNCSSTSPSSSSPIHFRWIALKPSTSLLNNTASSSSLSSSILFNHRLVPWTLNDSQTIKSVTKTLEKHLCLTSKNDESSRMLTNSTRTKEAITTKHQNSFLQMIYEEVKIMHQRKMKLELEALGEDLVRMIEDGI